MNYIIIIIIIIIKRKICKLYFTYSLVFIQPEELARAGYIKDVVTFSLILKMIFIFLAKFCLSVMSVMSTVTLQVEPSPFFFMIEEEKRRLYLNHVTPLTDNVRRIVHSKLKPLHFQIMTNYLI